MSGEADIIELRRRLSGIGRAPGGETFPATVREVDGDRRTCTVEAESVTYEEVLLYAVADAGRRGFCFLPAVGSIVLVSRAAATSFTWLCSRKWTKCGSPWETAPSP